MNIQYSLLWLTSQWKNISQNALFASHRNNFPPSWQSISMYTHSAVTRLFQICGHESIPHNSHFNFPFFGSIHIRGCCYLIPCCCVIVISMLLIDCVRWWYIHCVSKKVPTYKLSVTLSNLSRFSNFFALLESVWNVLQNPYDIAHVTLGMLLEYLGKLKIQISADI